jgi:hypothetical protein
MGAVEQLDLFAELRHHRILDDHRDVLVVSTALDAWHVDLIVRAAPSPDLLKHAFARIGNQGCLTEVGSWELHTSEGIQVSRWAGQQPAGWVIPWTRVVAIIRERTTPETAARLHTAVDAERAHVAATPSLPFVPITMRTAETDAEAEAVLTAMHEHIERGRVFTRQTTAALRAILPLPGERSAA